MSDALLERARSGDRGALEELLSHHAPAIYRFSLRMCQNAADAEDTLQDTLLAITNHLHEFAGRSSLSSWIFALTRSACVRRRRGLKNRPSEDLDAVTAPIDDAPSPEERLDKQQLTAALTAALERIPEGYREVLLLRDVEGLSAAEAADVLNISVEALKSRLHRARQALRDVMVPVLEAGAPPRGAACPDIVAAWSHKLEDELSTLDCAKMEQHLLTCPACNATCSALRSALLACRDAGSEAVPPAIQAQVKQAIRRFTRALQAPERRG